MPERRVQEKKKRHWSDENSGESVYEPKHKHDQYKRWGEDENNAYANFLENHRDEFVIEKGRKRKNLFIHMAEELDHIRDNEQCRTHHEKMMKKYKSVENIISNFKQNGNIFREESI